MQCKYQTNRASCMCRFCGDVICTSTREVLVPLVLCFGSLYRRPCRDNLLYLVLEYHVRKRRRAAYSTTHVMEERDGIVLSFRLSLPVAAIQKINVAVNLVKKELSFDRLKMSSALLFSLRVYICFESTHSIHVHARRNPSPA